jgi:HAD superfamily hydrolase (TIGR01509 family)
MCARVRGVLFDVAGTLLMPEDGDAWLRGGLNAVGAALGDDDVHALVAALEAAGRPGGPYPASVPETLAPAYAARDLDPDTHRTAYVGLLSTVALPHPELAEVLYERIRRPECWVPYADAAPVLAKLRALGLAVGVVSNVGFDFRPILAAHGLLGLLDGCVLSLEAGTTKPDPRIFAAACAAIGTAPEQTLMVGDHPGADGGAAAAGLQALVLPMTPAGGVHGLAAVLERV